MLWTAKGALLIDPAAHGGHPETDLAMLALFGLPHLEVVLDAYIQTAPLPEAGRNASVCTNCILCSCTLPSSGRRTEHSRPRWHAPICEPARIWSMTAPGANAEAH